MPILRGSRNTQFPFDISLILRRRCLYGKKLFFLFNWSLFIITLWNCTSNDSFRTKKWTNGLAAAREPIAMQPAKMGGASSYINGRFSVASQISSLQRRRPFFADAVIRHWNASSSRIRTSRSDQLADWVIPCSHPTSIQRASLKEQISRRCCKCCAVIVRRARVGFVRAGSLLSVNSCGWGNHYRVVVYTHCNSSSSSPLLSLVTSTSEISHQPVHTYTTG